MVKRVGEILLTGAVLLASLLACKGGDKGGAKSDEKAIAIKATDLFDEYHRNEVAADDKYKGKLLRVVGTVASLDKDAFDNIIVRMQTSNQFQSVMATMKDSEKSKVASLSKGQVATVECRGAGLVIGSPALSDCTVFGTGSTPAAKK